MKAALTTSWAPRTLIVLVCLAGVALFVLQKKPERSVSISGLVGKKETGAPGFNNVAPAGNMSDIVGVRQVVLGTEVLIVRTPKPRAVLLVFHGCSHSAIDWWYKSDDCASCLGLPEEVAVTKKAVARGYAVVAFSSEDRYDSRCWDNTSPDNQEITQVLKVWAHISEKEGWSELPRYGLGGSSGGSMVMQTAFRLPFDAICVEIMAAAPSVFEEKPRDVASGRTWPYPATYFVHMPRDTRTAEYVAKDILALRKKGVRVSEQLVWPRPLTPHFFSDRVDGISPQLSESLVNAFTEAGMLNSTGFLLDNPRETFAQWQTAIRQKVPEAAHIPLEGDISPIFEELNMAWAKHELAADPVDDAFDFFEASPVGDHPKMLAVVKP